MTAQSPGKWEKVLLEWRLMDGERKVGPDTKKEVSSISQLRNKMDFLFPTCPSKPHKSSACFSSHILQNETRRAALLHSGPVIPGIQLVKNPIDTFPRSTLGPQLPLSAGAAPGFSESTLIGLQSTLVITFKSLPLEVGWSQLTCAGFAAALT